jgi:MFS family permease
MTTDAVQSGKIDIGRVIGETFGVLRRNLATFSVLGLVLSGLPMAIIGLLQINLMRDQFAAMANGEFTLTPGYFQGVGISLIGALITSAILQGSLIYATVQDLNGQKASIGDSLATGLRNFLPLIIVSILFALAFSFGFILLFVPGIMIACAWCVAVPALVADRSGIFGSFGRSAELTRGNRWRIFGLFFIFFIALFVLGMIFNVITGVSNIAAGGPAAIERLTSPLFLVMQVIQQTITAVISSSAIAVLYVELRRARDGLGPQWLSEIFA